MTVGRCFDEAMNLNYSHKIKTGKDEKVSVVKDFFNDTFKLEAEAAQFEPDEKPDELKDSGIKTTGVFHKKICPRVKPKEVQVRDYVQFSNVNYELAVVVDLVAEGDIVIDNKYAGKTWAQGHEVTLLDPVIYSLWHRQRRHNRCKFRFDIAINTKTPKTDQRALEIHDEQIFGFLKFMATVHDSIEADTKRGLFYPRTDHFLCSKRKCGYWQKCQQEWGHKIKE
jgi:hypothetical protein